MYRRELAVSMTHVIWPVIYFIALPFHAKIDDMSWNVYGHDWAVTLLRNHVARNEMRHAYLFSGPQGIGRRTLALEFAKAINCLQPDGQGNPCGICSTCRKFDQMQQVDLSIVRSENVGGVIKVEQIRDLQHTLSLTPYDAAYRVALLLRFQEANANAQNALLKILEEPPLKVILLITVDAVDNLLPTVASRCEVLRLRPMPVAVLSRLLIEKYGMESDQAVQFSHFSGGRLGLALKMKDDISLTEQRQHWLAELERLVHSSRCDRFTFVEGIYRDRDKVRECLQLWLTYWRDVMILAAGSNVPLVNIDHTDQIRNLASVLDLNSARQKVFDVDRAIQLMDTTNTNIRILTEVLLLDWPRL